MLFVIQIGSAQTFSLAGDIDSAYATSFDRASQTGVEALALTCDITRQGIILGHAVPIVPWK
jgi:sugar fermentation stimulation protein A